VSYLATMPDPIIGRRIGRRVIVALVCKNSSKNTDKNMYSWECDCGKKGVAQWRHLRKSKQCRWCYEARPKRGDKIGVFKTLGPSQAPRRMLWHIECQRCKARFKVRFDELKKWDADGSCRACRGLVIGRHCDRVYEIVATPEGLRAKSTCYKCGTVRIKPIGQMRAVQRRNQPCAVCLEQHRRELERKRQKARADRAARVAAKAARVAEAHKRAIQSLRQLGFQLHGMEMIDQVIDAESKPPRVLSRTWKCTRCGAIKKAMLAQGCRKCAGKKQLLNGVPYSKRQLAMEFNIRAYRISQLIDEGKSFEEIVQIAKADPARQTKTYSILGNPMTARDITNVFGINPDLFRLRVYKGMEPTTAALRPVAHQGRKKEL